MTEPVALSPFLTSNSSGIAQSRKGRCNAVTMSTKSREVIFGSRIRGAKIHADGARERAKQAVREADRAEAEAWSIRMEGYGGPAQPSPTIGECLNGGGGWGEGGGKCSKTPARLPPAASPGRPRSPLWELWEGRQRRIP